MVTAKFKHKDVTRRRNISHFKKIPPKQPTTARTISKDVKDQQTTRKYYPRRERRNIHEQQQQKEKKKKKDVNKRLF